MTPARQIHPIVNNFAQRRLPDRRPALPLLPTRITKSNSNFPNEQPQNAKCSRWRCRCNWPKGKWKGLAAHTALTFRNLVSKRSLRLFGEFHNEVCYRVPFENQLNRSQTLNANPVKNTGHTELDSSLQEIKKVWSLVFRRRVFIPLLIIL